ncbi:MAG: sulfurtransferase [Flavobacteriales bacterium]|nr:sulfurtransferase [Flavobacteriales bacterium]
MVRFGGIVILGLLLFSCVEPSTPAVTVETVEQPVDSTAVDSNQSSLLSLEVYSGLIHSEQRVLLIDMRKPDDFEEGHIPGAHRIWRNHIQSADYDYGGMAADRERMESLLDSLGATAETMVVVYDAKGGCDAARFWWLLKMYGHPDVALLDGGWQAWKQSGKYAETGTPKAPIREGFSFRNEVDRSSYVGLNRLIHATVDSTVILVDTRTLDEFTGAFMKKGAVRAGHIPGAIHYDWGNAVEMGQSWMLKPLDDIQHDLTELGITPEKQIITYCHTGVRSAHTTFVLSELLGYENVKNYDGSWTEWSHMDLLPIAMDVEQE